MDIEAYLQIDKYMGLLKANEIEIPRIRGITLMANQEIVSDEEIKQLEKTYSVIIAVDFFRSLLPFQRNNNICDPYSSRVDKRVLHYISVDEGIYHYGDTYYTYLDIRWDRIHGKKKKLLKMAIKKANTKLRSSIETWNKYAGKEDILCVHSRIGGPNWVTYGGLEISKQPWFLEKIDSFDDNSYCDIFVKN